MADLAAKPAMEGGRPVRESFLVFGRPDIREEEIAETIETLRSGWIGTGPKTHRFEEEFAEYVHARHAVGLNSCTAGLHLALVALGVGPGDEVITTPMTFPSTANTIIHCGATPVFVDVDPDTLTIRADAIDEAVTSDTRAVIPVHLYGRPCELDAILAACRRHGLKLIEDAAHAVEAWVHDRKIGSVGDVTVFSFYATKNLVTAEGGMATTNDAEIAERLRTLSLHGLSHDAWKRYSAAGFQPYEATYAGFKYNMTDLQASLGIHQLRRLDDNLRRRDELWALYRHLLEGQRALELPYADERALRHARHLFAVQLELEGLRISRNEFIDALRAENIGSAVHFTPVHLHAYYRERYGYRRGDFPIAERAGDRLISLPLGSNLADSDVEDVVAAVARLLAYYRL